MQIPAAIQLYGQIESIDSLHALMIRIRPTISRNIWRPNAAFLQLSQTRFATIRHGGKTGRPKGATSYWSEEKLAVDEKYPLSLTMKKVIHPSFETKVKRRRGANVGGSAMAGGVHVRAQIVSPDLCGMSRPLNICLVRLGLMACMQMM